MILTLNKFKDLGCFSHWRFRYGDFKSTQTTMLCGIVDMVLHVDQSMT